MMKFARISDKLCDDDGLSMDQPNNENPTKDNIDKLAKVDIKELIDCHGKFKTIQNSNSYRYFGPRSIVSFVADEMHSIDIAKLTNYNLEIQLPELGTRKHVENHLYELYFAFQNSTLVFIWKELFYQQLNLPLSERNENFISESLQNATLAVGSIFDSNNINKFQNSINYAKRSRLILQDELNKPSISTVQTFGILSIFYIFLNEDSLAWNFHGSAISTAYSLGLNIGDDMVNNSGFFSNEEIELRRIAFWTIYILERALNNILGRPTFLKSESIINLVPSEIGIPEYQI